MSPHPGPPARGEGARNALNALRYGSFNGIGSRPNLQGKTEPTRNQEVISGLFLSAWACGSVSSW